MAIVGYVLVGFGLLCIFCNIAILVAVLRTKKHISTVGPIGALLFLLGSLPTVGWKLGLLGFVIDPGWWSVCFALVHYARSRICAK
jgi:hypothetical protein